MAKSKSPLVVGPSRLDEYVAAGASPGDVLAGDILFDLLTFPYAGDELDIVSFAQQLRSRAVGESGADAQFSIDLAVLYESVYGAFVTFYDTWKDARHSTS